MEFVTAQKNNQKALAAKFNLDKLQNYAFFRSKQPLYKIQKMAEVAKQSRVDLKEEIRCLDLWLKEY